MPERLTVERPGQLLAFLRSHLEGWGANTLRERLRRRCVIVNGETVTRGDHRLVEGDRIEVRSREDEVVPTGRGAPFPILFQDEDLVAIDKPAGLLSVSTDRQKKRTALALLRSALTPRGGRPAPLWPVHRLDRETSGVLLFARSREVRDAVQAAWSETQKVYLAVVDGHPKPAQGVIDLPLWEDKNLNVRVGRGAGGRDARTRFRTVKKGRRRALLEVELITGRRHQIRSHLAWIGHPIIGDPRYGGGGPRMGLHARSLTLTHPVTGEELVLAAPAPKVLNELVSSTRKL